MKFIKIKNYIKSEAMLRKGKCKKLFSYIGCAVNISN